MNVKELIEELKKYPEDTKVFTEYDSSLSGLTYIYEPSIDFEEEVKYDIEEDGRKTRASYLKHDGIFNNVLIIS